MPNWVLLVVRLFFSVGAVSIATWVGWKLGQLGWALVAFLFTTPLIGVAIARPLVELVHEGLTWLWRKPHEAWQGRYYEFNTVHVRVVEEDDRLWFCVADVAKACCASPWRMSRRCTARIPSPSSGGSCCGRGAT